MDLFGGLGNFFHGLGSALFGGGNDDQKKKQQEQQRQVSHQSQVQPGFHSAIPTVASFEQPQAPAVNLYQGPQELQKPAAKPQPQAQPQPQPQFAPPSALARPGTTVQPGFQSAVPSVSQVSGVQIPQNNTPDTGNRFGPLGDLVGSFAAPVVNAGIDFTKAAVQTPHALWRLAHNKPIDDIKQDVFGTANDAQIAPKIIGDAGTLALTAAAPGIETGFETLGSKVIPDAASTFVKAFAPKTAAGSVVGAGFGGSGAMQNGDDPGQIAASSGIGALAGGSLGFLGGIPGYLLSKFANRGGSELAQLPGEVSPGISSANPNREADAVQQILEKQQAQPQPAPQELMQPGQGNIYRTDRPGAPAPNTLQRGPVDPRMAAGEPQAPLQAPAPAPIQAPAPVEAPAPAPVVAAQPAEQGALPAVPADAAPAQAPAAPQTHDMIVKQLGDQGKGFKKNYSSRDVINLDDLKTKAQGVINNMDDDALIKSFSTTDPETIVNSPQSFAVARAAVDRLSKNMDDPAAAQTVSNLLDAMDRASSKSGQMQRIVQEEFDNMPVPMKVRYIIKQIDKANMNDEKYVSLSDRPQDAEIIDKTIANYLNHSEEIANRVSGLQGKLNEIADAAKNGTKSDTDINSLVTELKAEQRVLAENNGELVKYYQELVPGRAFGQKTNDFARNAMLSSFAGRVNDIATTATNIVHQGAQNVVQGTIAKAVNLAKPGKVVDTLRGAGAFMRGTKEGVKNGASEFTDKMQAGNLQKSLKNGSIGERTQLVKSKNPIGRTVQAATEFATHASEGVKEQRLYQLAVQEAQKAGIAKELVDDYAKARAAVPTRAMTDAADQLHKSVNNLNDNWVSSKLNKLANAIDPKEAATTKAGKVGAWAGGLVRNQVLPFTSWVGGNIFNTVTDKNVVAAGIKLINAARKGDADGVVENLAKATTHAGYSYGLGYLMSQNGIVTDKDAQGNSYEGLYLHIGDHYVPVAFTGFFAPSIILGHAAYEAINGDHKGDPLSRLGDFAGRTLGDWAKSAGLSSVMGVDNNITRIAAVPTSEPKDTSPGDTLTDTAATAGASVIGQYIPAITGDMNAFLNNYTDLNPTHEAADTNVSKVNPATGKDVKDKVASAGAGLTNRIPVASQLALPRKEGVASADAIDRVTHGNHDTDTSKQVRVDAKTQEDRSKADKAADIPDYKDTTVNFEDAVAARVQRGEYDKAISAYQQKLDDQKKNKNIPESKNKSLSDDITKLKVTKEGNYDPSIIDLYKKTELSEWRDMGDPESDAYDPKSYALLWKYDEDLSKSNVSRNTTSASDHFYSPKKPGKGRGGGSGGATSKAGGTISPTELKNISFGDLGAKKTSTAPIPLIPQIKATDLPKKRTISISKP